jgi:DNA invertase Pin-like site-specific DNA recombinase
MADTQKQTLKKAFGYLRVSSTGQVEGDGFPRQRADITRWAASNDVRIVRWFEEKGVSGKTELENRPALQDLLIALASNGVRTVCIEKLDRLARDLMIQETILAEFRKQGFEVISVAEPDLCSDDPSRTLVRQVFGAISQYERSMIVSKLRAARQRMRAKTGRCEGRKPFGAREGEQETIARMKEFEKEKLNYTQIADALNAEGLPTRTGSKWFPTTVSRTLAQA